MPPTTTRLGTVLLNVQDGLDCGRALHRLPGLLPPAPGDEPPALVAFNEAKGWREHRGGGAAQVERVLEQVYGARYQMRIGRISRSDTPPALAWRSDLFALTNWSDPGSDHHIYGHNTAWLAWAHTPDRPVLRVQVAHLDYTSGQRRLLEAESLVSQIDPALINVVLGDFNGALSGRHGGDRDWSTVPRHKRLQKGRLVLVDGQWRWVKDTRALDALVGPWDEQEGWRLSEHGAGLVALAELDWQQRGRPAAGLAPTTITDQALPIDHILADETVGLVPGSYGVRLPGVDGGSDHGAVSAILVLPQAVAA